MRKIYDQDALDRIKQSISLEDYISQYVDLRPRQGNLFGICPFHNEDTPSFAVNPKEGYYHCFGCNCGGDIFTFMMKKEGLSFAEAVEKASNLAGINIDVFEKSETVDMMKRINKKVDSSTFEHKVISRKIYDAYSDYIDDGWVTEGIQPEMFKRYEIKLDNRKNRIIYPVYSNDNQLINIKGRTLYEDFKTLKIPKYINYYKVGCMDYLQGLHLTRDAIHQKNEVIIFEGIKSCMKAEGFGYHNVVSAETCKLTREQIKLLISLRCNVIIAFDKDKKLSDFYDKGLKMLTRFTNVYYVNDEYNKLGSPDEKNAPVDKGREVWEYLYNNVKAVR